MREVEIEIGHYIWNLRNRKSETSWAKLKAKNEGRLQSEFEKNKNGKCSQ